MRSALLRNSLRLGVAAFVTAALSLWFERIAYVWYPMLAVITVMEDGDDLSLQAAKVRVFGTITGGLVTFLVHTVLAGWQGVLVSLLLMLPLLRWLGWQSAAGTATLVSLMFLMIPSHVALNWDYVFNRTLDTSVGCVIAILVGLLFWPRRGFDRLIRLEVGLRDGYIAQLQRQWDWFEGRGERPLPLPPAQLSHDLVAMEQLVAQERRGPHGRRMQGQRWAQRLQLWGSVQHHWVQWERLLAGLPDRLRPGTDHGADGGNDPLAESLAHMGALLQGGSPPVAALDPRRWQALARHRSLPLLPLLALAQEQPPLLASLRTLSLVARC
ncbi:MULTISPECIES: aromatic acid exporter family protein [unclassified Cyanobium]|uniref:FUSC family protein n=1 Tax=unclassified Cyanobium TaxID=2627006 RepID=UPI0020CDE968|nr:MULTISPECIES: FUSC family protein [unclassified Cyanobium]MCP9834720.1 FUSC family protein [Cyanobium sp. La Preciosa 7G6]MCP9937419.1 FUSC family protein [Cyanobium sp. Aljojuca 7A6]